MKWLSIDPGTHVTGLAFWENDTFRCYASIQADDKKPVEKRIEQLLTCVLEFGTAFDIRAVACEKPFLRGSVPAPELNVLFRRLKQEARRNNWYWSAYHPSTVLASVRPRGCYGQPAKRVIQLGIQMLYPNIALTTPQDLLDAIAVGHCHIGKIKEAQLAAPGRQEGARQ